MQYRYFFWFVVAFLCGIVFAATEWLLLTVLSLAVLTVIGLLFRQHRKRMLMAVLGMVIGFLIFAIQFNGYSRKIATLDGQAVTAAGRVEAVRDTDEMRLLVRGNITGTDFQYEDVCFYVYPKGEAVFSYGDTLSLQCDAYAPGEPKNFGESDYRLFCVGQNIYASFYPEAADVVRTGHVFSLFRPKDLAHALRSHTQAALSGRLSEEAEGFLRAVLTGDKSLLFAENSESLQRAGLSHIVAVSGLHLQIIIGAVMALFGIMRIRRRLFSVICYLLLTWFFVLFTGASASVLRAALMLSVFFFADFFRREHDSLTALAFSAFALCITNPGILFNIGFQLSFSSTLGILLFADKFAKALAFLPRFLRTGLSVSLAAMLGFTPLAAYHFGTVSLIGILANLLVCPLLGILMLTGFFAVLFAGVPYLSDVLFFCLDKTAGYILWVAHILAKLPGAVASLPRPNAAGLFLYLSLVLSALFLSEKKRRVAACFLCLTLLLFSVQSALLLRFRQAVTVTFLNVGNGDCVLVQTGGRTLLFDSGGSANTDVVKSTVLPYLAREGIRKIDAAFLTHYSTNHGYLTLMENGYIDTLLLPAYAEKVQKPRLLSAAKASGVSVRHLRDGDTVFAASLSVSVLDATYGDKETSGLVYRLEVAGSKILLTGKLDKNGQRRIVYRGGDVDCDILQVPSHGAEAGYLPDFMQAVQPTIGVISAHDGRPPDEAVPEAYAAENISIFRTDKQGTVRIRIFPDGRRIIQTLRQ
ncbi:MAG: DNA internalization-related competence protein ComEC/Rec2 [Ruminococcaceae bacterium]|nr:DNA internalization-related competence protein ComEC/Rec2 [Oscillospiraceae bacterium]